MEEVLQGPYAYGGKVWGVKYGGKVFFFVKLKIVYWTHQ